MGQAATSRSGCCAGSGSTWSCSRTARGRGDRVEDSIEHPAWSGAKAPGRSRWMCRMWPRLPPRRTQHEVVVALDNTWSAGILFKPFDHGVDISVQALTSLRRRPQRSAAGIGVHAGRNAAPAPAAWPIRISACRRRLTTARSRCAACRRCRSAFRRSKRPPCAWPGGCPIGRRSRPSCTRRSRVVSGPRDVETGFRGVLGALLRRLSSAGVEARAAGRHGPADALQDGLQLGGVASLAVMPDATEAPNGAALRRSSAAALASVSKIRTISSPISNRRSGFVPPESFLPTSRRLSHPRRRARFRSAQAFALQRLQLHNYSKCGIIINGGS